MNRIVNVLSVSIIVLTATGILMVSIMAFINPQSVMDLVGVTLPNTDAYSSIRGVYGGAGLAIFTALLYLVFTNKQTGLLFVALICGLYALSRTVTIFVEGNLGEFGMQWLKIESIMCILALIIYSLHTKSQRHKQAYQHV